MDTTTLIAENHICISRSFFYEGMQATQGKTYKKTVKKLALILLFLYLALAAWLWFTGSSLIFLFGESVFLGALVLWLVFILPRTRWRSKYRAITQSGRCIPERTNQFYRDYLLVTADTGNETRIPYRDIKNWQETKNLYLLSYDHNTYILLDKNGFSLGDFGVIKSALNQ